MDKKSLVLIHGALGSADELEKIAHLLDEDFAVFYYEIPGHGKRKNELANFDPAFIIDDFIKFLENSGPSYIFGFSLGGYLALSAAQKNSKDILGVITLGTKFNWTPETAARETKALGLDFLQKKVPDFYQYLVSLHGEHLPELLKATADFMITLGGSPIITPTSVQQISVPVRIIRGGKDKMVGSEESNRIANAISDAIYFEIPHFIHPIGYLKKERVAQMIRIQLLSLSYSFLHLPDQKIAFRTIERNSVYRLIFLHEALGSIAQWKNFPDQLCEQLNLSGTIIELKGYGFSSENQEIRGADYLHQFALTDLPKIIDALNYKEKLILVGHSDGGTNALLYGANFPEKIEGVITMAAHILNEPETRNGIPPAIGAFQEDKLNGLELYHGQKTEKLFYDWAHTWLHDFFHDWNISKDIKNISLPGLIIQGKKDQYGTDEQVHKIADCFTGKAEKLFIPDCGHAPHLEKQKEVIAAITKWFEQNEWL
jgi:pimeloyl-ACP methyl ester carboxylesterase